MIPIPHSTEPWAAGTGAVSHLLQPVLLCWPCTGSPRRSPMPTGAQDGGSRGEERIGDRCQAGVLPCPLGTGATLPLSVCLSLGPSASSRCVRCCTKLREGAFQARGQARCEQALFPLPLPPVLQDKIDEIKNGKMECLRAVWRECGSCWQAASSRKVTQRF